MIRRTNAASDADRRERVAAAAARAGLATRIPGERATELLGWGIQNTPPGAAITALAARCDPPMDLANTVVAWTLRGAPHVVPRADLGWWMAALHPIDEADLASRLYDYGSRLVRGGVSVLDGLSQTAVAMRRVLADRALSRSDLSTEVTKLVDDPYRPYCNGCRVVHVQENLFRFGALQAGVILDSEGRTTMLRLADDVGPTPSLNAARTELIQRFASLAEPTDPAHLAGWLATSSTAAKHLWSVAHAAAVRRPRAQPVAGVRLLPPSDPLLRLVDRTLLTPDPGHRKELFKAIGGPGAVLVDGNIAGTWRAKTAAKRLAISVHPWRALTHDERQTLDAEGERLADVRDGRTATVEIR
jgi:Winged helix DNA-binding domain